MGKKPKKTKGVGATVIEALKKDKTNQQVLDLIRKKFPDSKTSLASINWYRTKARAEGMEVPTSRELSKKC